MASLMEGLRALVVSQCQQPARTLYQSLDSQIKQAPRHLDFHLQHPSIMTGTDQS